LGGDHEDVTEQRVAELQRSSMREMESRRATIEAAIAGFANTSHDQTSEECRTNDAIHRGRPAESSGQASATAQAPQGIERGIRPTWQSRDRCDRALASIERDQERTRPCDEVGRGLGEQAETTDDNRGLADAAQKIGDV